MEYQLYDLEITTVGEKKTFNCSHKTGDGLIVKGENISFKPGTKKFSHYVLAALMPYIAAKQRTSDKVDWMYSETDISCTDPKCGAVFRFKRIGRRSYEYSPIS